MENNPATKGKWNVSFLRSNPFNNDSIYYITGKDNSRMHSIKECEANVKLIEKAVNNHYKLIEALKDCYSLLEDYNEEIPNNAKIARDNALNLLQSIEQQ